MSELPLASSETVAALVALGVAGATMIVYTVGSRVARGGRLTSEERMAGLVRELDTRMDEMGRELATALQRAREESRRGRFVGELAGSLELEDVMRRTVDAAAAVPGADAALMSVDNGGARPVTVSVGLSEEEIEEHELGPLPRGRRVGSMLVTFAPRSGARPGGRPDLSVGLVVPVHAQVDTVGVLAIFARGDAGEFSESQLKELEDLARRAAPIVENARRFREVRQRAELDELTGLHNRRYFNDTLEREIQRAHRYNRRLALLVFDIDGFKQINDRFGHPTGDVVLIEVADRVRSVVRAADIPCRWAGDEFAIILPESGLEDADQLYRRLREQFDQQPAVHGLNLSITAGAAELGPNDDARSLFDRCDLALYRGKRAGAD